MRSLLVLLVAVLLPSLAAAHISLTYPPPRAGMDAAQKIWPCGNLPPSATPTVFAPGATVEVEWRETIGHPGWYRIVFSETGTGFEDPTLWLDDDIPDRTGRETYTWTVTLPDVECETCVLQLVQVMTDKGTGYATPSGYSEYFACADLALRSPGGADGGSVTPDGGSPPTDAGGATPTDGGTPDAGPSASDGGGSEDDDARGGCATAAAPATGLPLVCVLVYSLLAHRTRRRTAA